MVAGLVAAWSQPQVAAHITTVCEPIFITNCEHESDSSECADSEYLDKSLRFRRCLLRHLLDLFIEDLNLFVDLRDLVNQRLQCRLQPVRQQRQAAFVEALGRATR